MIREPRSYKLEEEMLNRHKTVNFYYYNFQRFAKTARPSLGKRHFKSYWNNKNIWIQLDEWGNPEVTLHQTTIVRFLPHAVRLSAGGWKTHLTKTWINQFLMVTEMRNLVQENYEWKMFRESDQQKIAELLSKKIRIGTFPEGQRRKLNKMNVTDPVNKLMIPFENDMLVNWKNQEFSVTQFLGRTAV